ncbi:hypothetical protein K493DRAFT_332916 [Basidiobolus meristosporus CBS 931.73]|uniref:Uncharacterized protein n=1 Tax=Basidiobolus meristosporus CBS 931.73 TaxID=1314790 RepID=A0A1Y1Z9M4_9FUNG|nr:hypothetical protein K493DRAFT_332916 [Basidiobolus meristosporus CBS 931.73]|eukprot:ORY06959.1 hypothetical protein K493DRAFT_332916 [Basidiobolus meristosporus CBS 931.73]
MGSPRVEIEYCTQCRWVMRAGWTAQELLVTFQQAIGEVALVPGTGGVFKVRVDGELIWDRKVNGGFPELKELKQLVRDKVAPEMALGHSDSKAKQESKKSEENTTACAVPASSMPENCETCTNNEVKASN